MAWTELEKKIFSCFCVLIVSTELDHPKIYFIYHKMVELRHIVI